MVIMKEEYAPRRSRIRDDELQIEETLRIMLARTSTPKFPRKLPIFLDLNEENIRYKYFYDTLEFKQPTKLKLRGTNVVLKDIISGHLMTENTITYKERKKNDNPPEKSRFFEKVNQLVTGDKRRRKKKDPEDNKDTKNTGATSDDSDNNSHPVNQNLESRRSRFFRCIKNLIASLWRRLQNLFRRNRPTTANDQDLRDLRYGEVIFENGSLYIEIDFV